MRKPFEHDRLHDRAVKTKSWAGTELMQLVAIFVVFYFKMESFRILNSGVCYLIAYRYIEAIQ